MFCECIDCWLRWFEYKFHQRVIRATELWKSPSTVQLERMLQKMNVLRRFAAECYFTCEQVAALILTIPIQFPTCRVGAIQILFNRYWVAKAGRPLRILCKDWVSSQQSHEWWVGNTFCCSPVQMLLAWIWSVTMIFTCRWSLGWCHRQG